MFCNELRFHWHFCCAVKYLALSYGVLYFQAVSLNWCLVCICVCAIVARSFELSQPGLEGSICRTRDQEEVSESGRLLVPKLHILLFVSFRID